MIGLAERDQRVIWHPYTQAGLDGPAIPILRGEGARVIDSAGRSYIDAVSSWWVSIHGHAHPYIAAAVTRQLSQLEQVMFAGFTHEGAVVLAERLLRYLPGNQQRIFYSDNGSCAVEVALKMAVQYWYNKGNPRHRFLALQGGYHGDTLGAMSLGAGPFSAPFASLLFPVTQLPLPESEAALACSLDILERELARGDIAAFIFEPAVQGVAGMRIYPLHLLEPLLERLRRAGVLLIADEVMTGFSRCGDFFVSSRLQQKPDLLCLSKGLSGGTVPLGVTSATEELYRAFISPERSKMFLHGHSFSGNPVAIAAALASLDLLERSETQAAIAAMGEAHQRFLPVLQAQPNVMNARAYGTLLAFELGQPGVSSSYFSAVREYVLQRSLREGIILRPLGNTVYCLPPYVISTAELEQIYQLFLAMARDFR